MDSTLSLWLFMFFKSLLLLAAAGVVLSTNPVHSILFLVLTFVNASALLLLSGMEFIGLVILVVYVGAIAVLFLFVCMMLNVRTRELDEKFVFFLPFSFAITAVLALQLATLVYANFGNFNSNVSYTQWALVLDSAQNIVVLGQLLYTVFFLIFLLAAVVLLVAMLGAILLTLHHRIDVKRQIIFEQVRVGSWRILRT